MAVAPNADANGASQARHAAQDGYGSKDEISQRPTSVLPKRTDIGSGGREVRFVPLNRLHLAQSYEKCFISVEAVAGVAGIFLTVCDVELDAIADGEPLRMTQAWSVIRDHVGPRPN